MTIKKHNFSKITIFGQSESFHLSCASPGWVPSTGYKPLIHLRVHLIVQHSLSQTAFSVLFGYKTLVMYFSNT